MKEETKSKIREFIKPYFRRLPRPLQKNIYSVYMSKFFPKFFGKFGWKNIFKGWGMTTHAELPWEGGIGNEFFLEANTDIRINFEFSDDFKLSDNRGIIGDKMDDLLWRHWIISYAIRHAIEFTQKINLELVECGVGDGMSAFFVLKELKGRLNLRRINNFCMHLYDSWMPMRASELLPTEKNHIGSYKNINLDRVKGNLSEFAYNVVYHQGYIPESLILPPPAPESISYLHIDINSAMPTKAALELFFPRVLRGGVILFDDYGWKSYRETKKVVDKFFVDKPGVFMPLPTGQAIYYR